MKSTAPAKPRLAASDPGRPPARRLEVWNRQRACRLRLPEWRRLAVVLLEDLAGCDAYELGVHFVSAREMARVNQEFVQHEGPTDVISFDYTEGGGAGPLCGELFLCPEVAVAQAGSFRTTWPVELVRYLVHGILHLRGYDDLAPGPRRRMKQAEGRWVRALGRRFPSALLVRPGGQGGRGDGAPC